MCLKENKKTKIMKEIEKLAFALQHFAGLEEYDFQPSLVVCLVGRSHLLP